MEKLSKVQGFFRRGEASTGEQAGVESRELSANSEAESDTYDALRTIVVQRSEARPIPGGGRSRERSTEQKETADSVEARSHPGSGSSVGEGADKEGRAEQKEVTGSVKSERRPDVPPIIVVDYEANNVSEARELQQGEVAPNRVFADEMIDYGQGGKRRPRSKSLNAISSRLEVEEKRLEEERSRFPEVISNSREFEIDKYRFSRKLNALPSDRTVSERLRGQINAERLQRKSVESLRAEILNEPGGQAFIEEHDYSRGLTPQSRTPKKTSAELFEMQKQKAVEFLTKGAEKPDTSHSGNDMKFDKLPENLPRRLSVNDRGEGGLSQLLREESDRESRMLEEFPGLKNFRPIRRNRSASEGASPEMRPKVQPESRREQNDDDNSQPWPSREDPVW